MISNDICEICAKPYPADCTCPSSEDCPICNDYTITDPCIYHDPIPKGVLKLSPQEQADWDALLEQYGLEMLRGLNIQDIFSLAHTKGYMAGINWAMGKNIVREAE